MWQRDISRIIILLVCTTAIPNSSASECGRLCDLHWMANATVAQVEAEVDAGADPLSPGKRGHTPLHVAAQANPNPSIAALLIEYGADIQARSLLYDGGTPLHVAAGGYGIQAVYTNLLFRDILRTQGLERMFERRQQFEKQTKMAGNTAAIVEFLIDEGASVMALDAQGASPLHWAAAANTNPSVVELLLSRGATLYTRDNKKFTPLHWAAIANPNPEISQILLDRGADVDAHSQKGTPLHFAALNWNPEVILVLLKSDGCVGSTNRNLDSPLHRAVRNPVVEVSRHLLDYGANLEARNIQGRTPLLVALMNNPNADISRLLIERGAKISVRDKEGNSPIAIVESRSDKFREWSEYSYSRLVELLL